MVDSTFTHRVTARLFAVLAVVVLAVPVFVIATVPTAEPAVAATGTGAAASMRDYWDGRAEWVYQRKLSDADTGESETYTGAHVTIVGSTWYLFDRVNHTEMPKCTGGDLNPWPIGIQVRSSTNQGATWSVPTEIIAPGGTSQWSCYATDGDAYYNATTNSWTYLFQCLKPGGVWNGCVVTRSGSNPMGLFTTPAGVTNPVISSGQIWDQICPTAGTGHCSKETNGGVDQEGTFQIIKFDGTYYWIGFHGVDKNSPYKGYRGLAKTTDFVHYISGNSDGVGDTPTDATLGPLDAPSAKATEVGQARVWHENLINGAQGAGDAAIIKEDAYYYQMVEEPDSNFSGKPGQNWDYGIYRSKSLDATTTNWEPIPRGNPVVFSSTAVDSGQLNSAWLGTQYQRIFADPTTGDIYLTFGRFTAGTTGEFHAGDPNNQYSALYFFRLEKSTNLLTNGDFARADAWPWQANATTPDQTILSARREPNNSPNSGNFLQLSCNSACTAGQGTYQDVDVAAFAGQGRPFTARATIGTVAGTGAATITVSQYAGDGSLVGTPQTTAISASPSYTTGSLTGSLSATTARVRYMITPTTGSTSKFRLTDLALAVGGGTTANWPGADPGNLSRYAQVTASSQLNSSFASGNVRDGLYGIPNVNEWASLSDSHPWVTQTWKNPQLITSVTLMDRPGADDANGGTLTFSDGSTVAVTGIPHDGTPLRVEFPVRSATSVKFRVSGGSGPNVGLAEFEVHGSASSVAGDGNLATDPGQGNIAISRNAQVTASSQFNSSFASGNVRDGLYGTPNVNEWASLNDSNPWVTQTWKNPQLISSVTLMDRPGADDANGGTLTFSDGSTVVVTGIPHDGTPLRVEFPGRSATSVKFQVSGGSGPSVGLAEFEVRGGPTVTASSQFSAAFAPDNVIDGIAYGLDNKGEWASHGEQNPWVKVSWTSGQYMNEVRLLDRAGDDDANAGTLSFSDGSSVTVSGIAANGQPRDVTFAEKSGITWVKFQVSGGRGPNVGLAELSVWDGPGTSYKKLRSPPDSLTR